MKTDYEEFEEHMRRKEIDLSLDTRVNVGMKDEKDNLLILGGHKANLWRLPNGLYAVAGERTISSEQAIELYNLYNGTNLSLDYVWKAFEPWYAKQSTVVASVPSKTDPSKTYTVRKGPNGELTCECQGFLHRRECWHTTATRELMKEESTSG